MQYNNYSLINLCAQQQQAGWHLMHLSGEFVTCEVSLSVRASFEGSAGGRFTSAKGRRRRRYVWAQKAVKTNEVRNGNERLEYTVPYYWSAISRCTLRACEPGQQSLENTARPKDHVARGTLHTASQCSYVCCTQSCK